jgi:tetratricopeptide (TPR) repeat protein
MPATQQFTRSAVLRIVGITPQQLGYWERLALVTRHPSDTPYTFTDLVRLRTVKSLTSDRLPAARLRHALDALRHEFGADVSLGELRVLKTGKALAVAYHGTCIEPLSGQMVLDFNARREAAEVHVLPEASVPQSTVENWLEAALECEANPERRAQAIEAYRRALELAPQLVEAHLNLGALLYEQEKTAEAAECFRRAVALAPQNPLAHFNLGSVLDDLGKSQEAARHLEEAVRLDPNYADAYYNLARVREKLGAPVEARRHWRRYLELDPQSPWSSYARERLEGGGRSL